MRVYRFFLLRSERCEDRKGKAKEPRRDDMVGWVTFAHPGQGLYSPQGFKSIEVVVVVQLSSLCGSNSTAKRGRGIGFSGLRNTFTLSDVSIIRSS